LKQLYPNKRSEFQNKDTLKNVILAQARIHTLFSPLWIPAFAGMTAKNKEDHRAADIRHDGPHFSSNALPAIKC
jgi:hypothetical protein